MKKFKITMIATSVKEVFLSSKSKKEALEKIDKLYLDDEDINFNDNDIVNMNISCKEIQSVRREKFFGTPDYVTGTDKEELINDFIDTFIKAEKVSDKDNILHIKITKEQLDNISKKYKLYKEKCK